MGGEGTWLKPAALKQRNWLSVRRAGGWSLHWASLPQGEQSFPLPYSLSPPLFSPVFKFASMEAVVIVWCGVSINPAQPVALADSIASLLERQRSMSFSFLILSVTVVFLQEEIVCVCVCVCGET